MTYTLVRNETITNARARGVAYDVVDAELSSIGVIAEGEPGWRVHSAGSAVPVDQNTWHGKADEALDAILAARAAASEPGGMLHVDETGLTGFQRAVIDFAGLRWTHAGTRATEIWARFDMHPMAYSAHLLALLENPKALAYSPQLVATQTRLRDARKARRTGQHRRAV